MISDSGMFLGILGIHADAVWGGLIGGVTVCFGVLLAEWFARKRELTFRFDDAFERTMERGLRVFFVEPDLPIGERANRSAAFRLELAMLHQSARHPLHNHKKLKQEMDAILARFEIASAEWLGPNQIRPLFTDVMSDKIGILLYRPRKWWVI